MTQPSSDFLWRRIYSATDKIKAMKPWEWMEETDIFGIESPETGEIYFISVMGSGGISKSISAYIGKTALGMFWNMINMDQDGLASDLISSSYLLTIPQLFLDFTEEEGVEPGRLVELKKDGMKPDKNNIYTVVSQIKPGFLPSIPDDNVLKDAAAIYEQCLEIFSQTKDKPELVYPDESNDDLYLIRKRVNSDKDQWTNVFEDIIIDPVRYEIRFRIADHEKLKTYQKKPVTLQIDIITLPAPSKEGSDHPYFPSLFLIVDKKSGTIIDYELLTPLPEINSLYKALPGLLITKLLRLQYKPYRVDIRSDILFTLFEELLTRAGIQVHHVESMKPMDEAINGMVNNMFPD